MNRYVTESPHSGNECLEIVKQALSAGYASHFEWGCAAGIHKVWITIEAENELAYPP